MSQFTKESLVAHAKQYPHDVEPYVVPCMRKMVKSGFTHDATSIASKIVLENPSLTYLMVEFMSEIARKGEMYRYMDKAGEGPRSDIRSVATIYNRYN